MIFRKLGINSIRFKLIVSMLVIALFLGLLSLFVGGDLLYRSVLGEVNNRVAQDLNLAGVIYDKRIESARLALEIIATETGSSAVDYKHLASLDDRHNVIRELNPIFTDLQLDFFGFTKNFNNKKLNPLVEAVLKEKKGVAGTVVVSNEKLFLEDPNLAMRANIQIATNQYDPLHYEWPKKTPALILGAAVPLHENNKITGVLYGGFLLNRNTTLVDEIGEAVFKKEMYKGRNVGTATIFYRNLRIATSVPDSNGNRAVGTFASQAVTQRVLRQGEPWTDRAKVLDDWYITAYRPIIDLFGERVGMFYVGVLEDKYWDVRKNALQAFAWITLAGIGIAFALGWFFTSHIMQPVSKLIRASDAISDGDFSPNIGKIEKGDLGKLQKKFLQMAAALKGREEAQRVKREIELIQSEKQASIGKLAAGVAHEINNPLTAVLTFTHLILRRNDLPIEVKDDLEMVAAQTERVRKIVKSLLDFSRQTALRPEATDLAVLVSDSVRLMQNQALVKGVALTHSVSGELPSFLLDRNQFQSVLINMIINALDATSSGGKVHVSVKKQQSSRGEGAQIIVKDTGSGIDPAHIERLFDPFFTTKDVGKGTGLGLAVSVGIIQRHGGTVTVCSEPGEGTSFAIWLPISVQETEPF